MLEAVVVTFPYTGSRIPIGILNPTMTGKKERLSNLMHIKTIDLITDQLLLTAEQF